MDSKQEHIGGHKLGMDHDKWRETISRLVLFGLIRFWFVIKSKHSKWFKFRCLFWLMDYTWCLLTASPFPNEKWDGLRELCSSISNACLCNWSPLYFLGVRASSLSALGQRTQESVAVSSAVPVGTHSAKVIFSDHRTCDFKFIWVYLLLTYGSTVYDPFSEKLATIYISKKA